MVQLFVKDGSFYKSIVSIAVPIVLQSLITIGVNLADTMMLGSYGEYQISGSSLANEFINIFHIMCMGMGYGAAVLTSQCWGSGNIKKLRKVITIMLRVCLLCSVLFGLITVFFPASIMAIYTDDVQVIENGMRYFKVSAFAYIPMGISLTLTAVLRSVREVKLPLYSAIVALFTNIFFNWLFIFGNLGMPEMQITGAALGTLIARLVEVGIIAGYFFFADQKIQFRMVNLFDKCGDMIKPYVSYSVPVLISDTLLGLGNTMVSVIMGHIGASFVAANAIVSQVTRMSTVFTQGVSNSSSVITGNTLGEGDREKAYRQGITFLCLAVLLGVVAGGIILLICPWIIESFNIEASTKKVAYSLMYAVAIMVVFQCVQSVLTKGVLRGGGDTKFLMVADIVFLWLVSVPLGYYTGLVWQCSALLVYASLKADWVIKSVLCTVRLIQGKWMKRF